MKLRQRKRNLWSRFRVCHSWYQPGVVFIDLRQFNGRPGNLIRGQWRVR